MSAQKIITQHLDIWTAAHKTRSSAGRGSSNKLDLYGIKKMRELILELAVRGKLVPQDPNDEPASELLKKIVAEKEKLIKEGKVKKEKPLQEITDEEKPFELPSGWECIRLGKIATIKGGKRLPNGHSFSVNETPHVYIRVTDMKNGTINDEGLVYIRPETHSQISQYVISSNDLYITIAGTIGAVGVVPQQFDGMNLTENAAKIIFQGVEKSWLQKTLSSSYIQEQFNEKTNQLAQPKLALHRIESSIVFLPPLAEQHRIVAKVDELMAFCDQLEQTQNDNIAAHAQLVKALLASLTNSADHNELQTNWQRIAAHFDTLFTTEHSIDQLKQTILQLAVMGKLVPQNPSDEPASELLKRIAAEKAQLIKEGKIKKEKPLPEITDEEKPFELPSGWEWLRFNDLINVQFPISYGVLVPGLDESGGVPFIRIADLDIKNPPEKPEKSISAEIDAQYERTRIYGGEILMGVVGSIGKLGVAPMSWKGANIARAICRIKFWDFLNKDYGLMLLQSEFMQNSFLGDTRTLAQPTLNIGFIRISLTPLPPLAEQHRIVAKVDELMALCNKLKANLQNAQSTQLALADALVEQAVN